MGADSAASCVSLGISDVYAVRSNHGAAPYLVACLVDGRWTCSCPANHNELRAGGRYCRPIREVIALRQITSIPPSPFDHKGGH